MRKTTAAFVFSALAVIAARGALAGPAASTTQTAPGDKVAVLARADAVDLTKAIPLSLDDLDGVKVAFQTMGTVDARFWLHDEARNRDLAPQRGVWKLTGVCPHVPGYAWGGGNWTPCLYRLDLFGQDAMCWRKNLGKPPMGRFTHLRFAAPGSPKDALQVHSLVVYRGEDNTPPAAPEGLAARPGEDGTHLSWKPAADDVGVSWYVISRAAGKDRFVKIAQTAELAYLDKPPAAGTYRYRVLAVDYQRNLGPWSEPVSVTAVKGFDPPAPAAAAVDAEGYAAHVRAVHEAGAGKVERGVILFHGDSLNYLDRTRNHVASLISLLPYGCVNESSQVIRPGNPSAKLVKELARELELRPEFCVLSAGLEDLHPTPFPEDDHTTAQDIQKAVDNVLTMVRMCERQGTVAVVTTPTPFGHNAPKGSPEEALSEALVRMCQTNNVPVARAFDLFRRTQEAGEDYKALMTGPPRVFPAGSPEARFWKRGYEFDPYTPSFELGITRRIIVVKETLDRVLFVLLDRPEQEKP